MKELIDIDAEARKVAKNEFEKDFYKLMSNSVYRKTMEEQVEHQDFKRTP